MPKPTKTDSQFEYVPAFILVEQPGQTLETEDMPRGRKKGSKNASTKKVGTEIAEGTYAITDGNNKTHITQDPISAVQEFIKNGQSLNSLTARKMDKVYTLKIKMLPKEEAAKYALPDITVFQPAADAEGSKTVAGKLPQVATSIDSDRPFFGVSENTLGFVIQLSEQESKKKSSRGRPRKVSEASATPAATGSGT